MTVPAALEDLQTLTAQRPRPGVLLLTLDRPDRLNAMTMQMFEELARCAAVVRADPATRALVITGAGKGFCAGYDLHEAAGLREQTQRETLAGQELAASAIATIHDLPQPVLAAVNGAAAGGGLSLALACDIRIASTAARFDAVFVRIGLSGGDLGVSWFLPRIVGLGVASELLYTGRRVGAEEALRLGLVSRVAPPEQLLEQALQVAVEIAAAAPLGVRMTKRSLIANVDAPSLRAALELENRGQAMLTRGEDLVEALAAFAERRPPRFED
jgi:enoyl-CoA hydratase/carnithine racemase